MVDQYWLVVIVWLLCLAAVPSLLVLASCLFVLISVVVTFKRDVRFVSGVLLSVDVIVAWLCVSFLLSSLIRSVVVGLRILSVCTACACLCPFVFVFDLLRCFPLCRSGAVSSWCAF